MSACKRLLFFSLEKWTEIKRRNRFVCSMLAERHPEVEILWVNPVFPSSLFLRRLDYINQFHTDVLSMTKAIEGCRGFFQVTPFRPLPNRYGQSINRKFFVRTIEGALDQLGWKNCIAWVNDQSVQSMIGTLPIEKLIYDITDNWIYCSLPSHKLKAIEEDDNALISRADAVIVCSQQLYESKSRLRDDIHLIPNGVDAAHYHPSKLATETVPSDMVAIRKPIAGYTGTLHEDRLDINLVYDLAKATPEFNFVFVGPNRLTQASMARLNSLANCHILGGKSYEQLSAYMSCFDVCICPHKVTRFTDSLDPLKLYEYLSTGKPVISTSCAGFRDYPQFVYLADDSLAFRHTLLSTYNCHNAARTQSQLNWAQKQSWQVRVDEIEKVLGWHALCHSELV